MSWSPSQGRGGGEGDSGPLAVGLDGGGTSRRVPISFYRLQVLHDISHGSSVRRYAQMTWCNPFLDLPDSCSRHVLPLPAEDRVENSQDTFPSLRCISVTKPVPWARVRLGAPPHGIDREGGNTVCPLSLLLSTLDPHGTNGIVAGFSGSCSMSLSQINLGGSRLGPDADEITTSPRPVRPTNVLSSCSVRETTHSNSELIWPW